MKFLIVVLALVAVAAAQQQGKVIAIIRQASDVAHDHYQYNYETANGISVDEQGQLKAVNNEEGHAFAAQGQFAYTAPDGTPIQLTYVADENGFQPQGAHLPVAPPVPEAILRSIAYNEAHPSQESNQ